MTRLYKQNLISMSDLDITDIEKIIAVATKFKKTPPGKILANNLIASCFFEPSTRTRLSFEAAALRLGCQIIGLGDVDGSSVAKGETFEDSIKVISSYVDVLLLRHSQAGIAELATKYSNCPIINCGDGANQHPTQTLIDLFTINECQHKLDNLHIAFVGDLKYARTVNSLINALSNFNTTFYFIADSVVQIPEETVELLKSKNINCHLANDITDIIANVDIVYMTRLQKERFCNQTITEYNHKNLHIQLKHLRIGKENLKILHPLPRLAEIPVAIDKTPQAYYFEQAANGIYIRQALLSMVLQ